ncbi:MAG: hypothetical protein E4H03_04490 [Myxococcales bacterium]|jgi:hypothetical protein|nr:MAG: hypothetical protein E4H03_04490 [Myxococcales bacterium]
MERTYRLRRLLGKVIHDSDTYFISVPVMGEGLEILEKKSDRIITPSDRQREHFERCRAELAVLTPDAATGSDSEPLSLLIEDFANAVFHNGQHLERAFFKLSPKSRACSVLARTGIGKVVQRESEDPFYDQW